MCQIFVIQISGIGKSEVFSQRTYDFQHFGNEALFIADYQNVKKSAFDWFATKLLFKESTVF